MTITSPSDHDTEARPHGRVTALYHPTLAVEDLELARTWFRRVFGRDDFDVRWEDAFDLDMLDPEYPTNYSFFAFVHDFHFVVLCPALHARGALAGQKRYAGVTNGMIGIGWYVDDAVEVFDRLLASGIRAIDQQGRLIDGDNPPISSIAPEILVGFTYPEDTGMRVEFEELGEKFFPAYGRRADPRLLPGWTAPGVSPTDPLGIVRSSHHTVVTPDLARATRLYVDELGAERVGEGYDAELDADTVFLRLADTTMQFAVPRADSPFAARVADGTDSYFSITLQVADVAAAEAHLTSVGLHPEAVADGVVLQPDEAFGMQWRFVSELPWG